MRSGGEISENVGDGLRSDSGTRTDSEIARDAVSTMQAELPCFCERISVAVMDGVVTLEGDVEWTYQRDRPAAAVRKLPGVKSVTNRVGLGTRVTPAVIRRRIEELCSHSTGIAGQADRNETSGSDRAFRSTVRSWAECSTVGYAGVRHDHTST